MLRKTSVILVTIFSLLMFLTTAVMSQVIKKPMESTGPGKGVLDCSSQLAEQMSAEAMKFKIDIDRKTRWFYANENTTSVFMPIVGREKLTEKDFLKGTTTGLLYVESNGKARVPNGYYRLQLTLSQKPKTEKETIYFAELFALNGKPVIKAEIPISAYIVCWQNGVNWCDPRVLWNLAVGNFLEAPFAD